MIFPIHFFDDVNHQVEVNYGCQMVIVWLLSQDRFELREERA